MNKALRDRKKLNLVSGPFRMYVNRRLYPKPSTKNYFVHRAEATETLRLSLRGTGFCFVLFFIAWREGRRKKRKKKRKKALIWQAGG